MLGWLSADTAATLAGICTGHHPQPVFGRLGAERLLVQFQRLLRAFDVDRADARVVMQVAAEDALAVVGVIHRVEHVHVPDLVHVMRRHHLALGMLFAERQELLVFGECLIEASLVPVTETGQDEGLDAVLLYCRDLQHLSLHGG